MTRTAAMTAVSAFCLLWTAGCASTGTPGPQAASAPANTADVVPDAHADVMPDAHADVATLAKNLPSTLNGEIRRAQLLRAKGDYDEAARSLAQLMLVEPDDGRVVGEYGKVLEQEGHSRDALPFLKRAAQLSPNDWSIQSALGVAYDQVDDHTSARGAYGRALALKPGEGSVLNNYAVSRMLAGDYAGAKRLFAQAEANGASNPKLAGNLEKLAALAPQPAPQPAPAPAAPPKPATPHVQAAAAPDSVKSNVTVAAVPQVQHASMPATTKDGHVSTGVRVAVTAPKALGGQVVMQRVPHDPLAGPVAVRHAAPKLASNAPKPPPAAKKPQPETPSLRTAADAN
jgi:Flp pilus assembly protein TadD